MRLAITECCRRAEVIGLIDISQLAGLPLVGASVRKKHRENRVTSRSAFFSIFLHQPGPVVCRTNICRCSCSPYLESGSLSSCKPPLTTPEPRQHRLSSPHRHNIAPSALASPPSATTYSSDPASISLRTLRDSLFETASFGASAPPVQGQPSVPNVSPHTVS